MFFKENNHNNSSSHPREIGITLQKLFLNRHSIYMISVTMGVNPSLIDKMRFLQIKSVAVAFILLLLSMSMLVKLHLIFCLYISTNL
jgi:hypothetical protein